MTDDLVLYSNPMSRGRIARWMLEETGMPYRYENVAFDAMKAADYRSVNPMGKVPTLRHGTVTVTECAAICAYLADAFPQAELAPPVSDRGAYYRWLFFAAGPLEQAVVNKALGFELPPGKSRMAGYGSYEDVLHTLEQVLTGQRYIAGDRFSATDLYLTAHLHWGMQFGSIEKRQAFIDYTEPHVSRPAALRAAALDDVLAHP